MTEFIVGDRIRVKKLPGNYCHPWMALGDEGVITNVPEPDDLQWWNVQLDTGREAALAADEMHLMSRQVSPNTTIINAELTESATLDPTDPFERVLMDMVRTNRAKRRDYAVDGSPFSNFDNTSEGMGLDGFGAAESAEFNVRQKLARLRSLRQNGRLNDTANEAVADTYLDLAVYAVIALAISRFPTGEVID